MTCEEMMDLMQNSLDQELEADEERAMLAHLKECPDCTDLYARLKLLSDELAQLPKVKPAYSIVDAILPQLEAMPGWENAPDSAESGMAAASSLEATPEPGNVLPMRRKPGFISWKVFSGVVAAGLVLGMFIFNQNGGRSDKSAAEQEAGLLALSGTVAPEINLDVGENRVLMKMNEVHDDYSVQEEGAPESAQAPDEAPVPESLPAGGAGDDSSISTGSEEDSSVRDSGREVSVASPRDSADPGLGQQPASNEVDEAPPQIAQNLSPLDFTASGEGVSEQKGGAGEAEATSITGMPSEKRPTSDEAGALSTEEKPEIAPAITIKPLASPDGQYTASLTDYSVTITAHDGTVAFVSDVRMEPGDKLAFTGWEDDDVFAYTLTKADGQEKLYLISVVEKKEWTP